MFSGEVCKSYNFNNEQFWPSNHPGLIYYLRASLRYVWKTGCQDATGVDFGALLFFSLVFKPINHD